MGNAIILCCIVKLSNYAWGSTMLERRLSRVLCDKRIISPTKPNGSPKAHSSQKLVLEFTRALLEKLIALSGDLKLQKKQALDRTAFTIHLGFGSICKVIQGCTLALK